MNWQELSVGSHYLTAVAVKDALTSGNITDAKAGIEELIDALSRSERRAIRSHLICLMAHVIKWQTQPNRRSRSWCVTIENARDEISEIQEETPSLNRDVIEAMWAKCFKVARREAEVEMNCEPKPRSLSWKDVFETVYEYVPGDAEVEDEQ